MPKLILYQNGQSKPFPLGPEPMTCGRGLHCGITIDDEQASREHCRIGPDCDDLLRASVTELGLSARAHDKVLRVARTIADLEGAATIQIEHLTEAVNYRLLDRQLWK